MTDFPELVERLAPILLEKKRLQDRHQRGRTESAVVRPVLRPDPRTRSAWRIESIGVVTGDDVLGLIPDWIAQGIDLSHLETGAADLERGLAAGGRQCLPGGEADCGRTAIGRAIRGDRPGRRRFA